MKAADKHIDPHELLVKYITGEANAAEKQQVEKLIGGDDENRRYYEHFKLIWDESLELANDNDLDEDKAWVRFRERIQKEYIASTTSANNYKWLKVAAVILLASAAVLFAPGLFKHREEARYTTIGATPNEVILRSVTTNEIKTDTLPDGSTITQNKNSTLSYPATFAAKDRTVELSGEAFFNVWHDRQRPFIIKVSNVQITVLGTSFNVKSNGKITEVIVETGIVRIQRRRQTATLHPGEKLTATDTSARFKKESITDKSYRYYLDEKVKIPEEKHFQKDTPKLRDQVKRDPIKHDSIRTN